jgi:hypothetical protein
MENYLETKRTNKRQDLYVAEFTQQGTHMGCSSKDEFYRDKMVLSISPSKRNYSSSHHGIPNIQEGMERGGKINRDLESLGREEY